MSQAPSMPLFCDAYLADTMHLSLEEHGAYPKLLMITWRNNGQPLPDDDARIARMPGTSISRWTRRLGGCRVLPEIPAEFEKRETE